MNDKIIYTDFESLFERWAIMTTGGGLSDDEALKALYEKTTPRLYLELARFIARKIAPTR